MRKSPKVQRLEEATTKFTTEVLETKTSCAAEVAWYQERLEERSRFADERLETPHGCQSGDHGIKVVLRAKSWWNQWQRS